MSLSNSRVKFSVVFDIAKKDSSGDVNANYKKITITDETDYDAASVDPAEVGVRFVITNPLDQIIHAGSFGSPDISPDSSLEFSDVDIDVDSNGNLMLGTYKIQMYSAHGESIYNSEAIEFVVCNGSCSSPITPSVTLEFNCNSSIATGRDATTYPSGISIDRILSLYPPGGAKYTDGTVATPFTSTTNAVQSNALWTQSWEVLLRAVLTKEGDVDGFDYTVISYIEGQKEAKALCEINLCSLYSCLTKKLDWFKKQACLKGGLSNNLELTDELLLVLAEVAKLESARQCGNITRITAAYERLEELLECDCGCGDTDTVEYVYALVESAPEGLVNVQGSTFITVTSSESGGTTTYTVSLSDYFNGLIDDLAGTTVTSEDGSVSITVNENDAGITFDLSVNVQAVLDDLLEELDLQCIEADTFVELMNELIDGHCTELLNVAVNDSATTTEDTAVVIEVLNNDVLLDAPYSLTKTNPLNGTVVINVGNTITYTPNSGFVGTDSFTYTITANGNTTTATVYVTVTASDATCIEPVPAFTANINVDGEDLVVEMINITNYNSGCPGTVNYVIVFKNGSGNVVFTSPVIPGNNDTTPTSYETPSNVNYATAVITMQVIVDDCDSDVPCDSASVTNTAYVIPTEENDPPVAANYSFTTESNVPYAAQIEESLLVDVTDPNGDTVTAQAGTFATTEGGSVTINTNGTFTYTPPEDYVGEDSFTYTAFDEHGASDAGTVTFTVEDACSEVFPMNEVCISRAGAPNAFSWTTDYDPSVTILGWQMVIVYEETCDAAPINEREITITGIGEDVSGATGGNAIGTLASGSASNSDIADNCGGTHLVGTTSFTLTISAENECGEEIFYNRTFSLEAGAYGGVEESDCFVSGSSPS